MIVKPFDGIWPRIHPEAFVAENAAIIGDVEIGAGSTIWYNVAIRGDVNIVRIGAGSNVQDGTVIHVSSDRKGDGGSPTRIGSRVSIAHMCLIHGATLEDGSFVGSGAVVMDDVVVESGAMVAAGALVTPGKRVPRGELWAGRPAKLFRHLTPEDLATFPGIAERYVKLGAKYRAAARG